MASSTEILNKTFDGTDSIRVTGGSGGGGATTIADGADVTQGANADAVVAAGAAGSVSAKLRRLTTDLDAVKTSVASIDTKTSANQPVVGNVASGATDSGNPVKTGGVNMTTQPTLTDAQRGDTQLDTRGNTKVTLMNNNNSSAITVSATNADARATSATASRFEVVSDNYIFNGTTYDRQVAVTNATNSIGTGITAAGLVAQLDDASPTAITENSFGNVRMSTRRSLLTKRESQNSITYSASSNVTLAAAATDFFTITGNASTTVNITKIRISGTQTTGGMASVSLIKRSTANSAGTSSAVTAVPHDSSDAAASATLLAYTANPTTGTPVGTIRQDIVPFATATATTNNVVEWTFGGEGRPIVLRGTTQVAALNLAGVTLTGGSVNIDIEWYEY